MLEEKEEDENVCKEEREIQRRSGSAEEECNYNHGGKEWERSGVKEVGEGRVHVCVCVCAQRDGENRAGGGGGRERVEGGKGVKERGAGRGGGRVGERGEGGGRGARQEGREGENVQRHRGVGGTECSGERERGEGEVKDRGREHEEEEAEVEGREGEISSCQMVSNKTSASSHKPQLNRKSHFLHGNTITFPQL